LTFTSKKKAVNGEEGVYDVLSLLKAEFEQAMILAGVRTIAEIDESILFKPSLQPNAKL